jgi:SNF2 family DNA or RNA helicase
VQTFQEGGGVIVATYGSLGMGVTLTRARAAVLHDMPWTFAAALQAEKRVHRIGSKQSVHTYWMLAEESVDTLVARVLLAKAARIAETLDVGDAAKAATDVGLADVAGTSADVFQETLDAWLEKVA